MPRQYVPEMQPVPQELLPVQEAPNAGAPVPPIMYGDYAARPPAEEYPGWVNNAIANQANIQTTSDYFKDYRKEPSRPRLQYVTDERLADIRQQALKTALEIYEGSDKTKSICQLASEYEQWLLGND